MTTKPIIIILINIITIVIADSMAISKDDGRNKLLNNKVRMINFDFTLRVRVRANQFVLHFYLYQHFHFVFLNDSYDRIYECISVTNY